MTPQISEVSNSEQSRLQLCAASIRSITRNPKSARMRWCGYSAEDMATCSSSSTITFNTQTQDEAHVKRECKGVTTQGHCKLFYLEMPVAESARLRDPLVLRIRQSRGRTIEGIWQLEDRQTHQAEMWQAKVSTKTIVMCEVGR
jgi:hypothetical protein